MLSARRRGRWSLVLLGLFLVCGGLPSDSQAYVFWPSGTGKDPFWAHAQATLNLQLGCPDPPLTYKGPCWDDAAKKAAEEWNAAGSQFRFVIADPPDPPPDACDRNDGVTTVAWTDTICGRGYGGTLATAVRLRMKPDGEIIEADLLFNNKEKWTTHAGPGRQRPGPWDFYRIALHEFGHALGLLHPDDNGQSVTARMNSGVFNTRSLQADDRNGAVALYGNDTGGAPAPPPAFTVSPNDRRLMIVGDALNFRLSATTGTPPLTYRLLGPQATCQGPDPATPLIACPGDGTGTVVDPDWPAGLTFDASTRTLSGTLTALGPAPVLRRVHDSVLFTRHTDPYTETAYTYLVTDNADPPRTARTTVRLTAQAAPLHFDRGLSFPLHWEVGVPLSPLSLPRVTNAPGPLTYTFEPALPSGLRYDAAAHTLSGTPTRAQALTTVAFVATEQVPHPRATEVHTHFTVVTPPPLTFDPPTLAALAATEGEALAPLVLPRVPNARGTVTYTLSGLPTGLTFETTTRTLSGTPATGTAGVYTLTYIATETVPPRRTAALTFAVTIAAPPRPPPPPPPPPPTTGGGGRGGTRTPADRHGDTPAEATTLNPRRYTTGALSRTLTAHLQNRRDVDYFTLSLPSAGILTAATTGADTTGQVFQAQEEGDPMLIADDTDSGPGRNFALGTAVEPGTYYLAVSAGRGSGEYTLSVHYTPAFVDNPGPASPQSGLGVLSGWVCATTRVEIELTPANGAPVTLLPATGTARADTAAACGPRTTDTGFGLLFNWNLLGDGAHSVRVLIDDVLFAERAITVTTLGAHSDQEYRRGLRATSALADFPAAGHTTTLRWAEALQNFVIASGEGSDGGAQLTPEQAWLENPAPGSFQSGLGVISGWVCEADTVELVFEPGGTADPLIFEAGAGTERADTADRCGDTANGFGLLFNWNLLGDGTHTVRAVADGDEFAHSTVTVTTLAGEFARGLHKTHTIADFPTAGQTTTVEWQESQQNFVITGVE